MDEAAAAGGRAGGQPLELRIRRLDMPLASFLLPIDYTMAAAAVLPTVAGELATDETKHSQISTGLAAWAQGRAGWLLGGRGSSGPSAAARALQLYLFGRVGEGGPWRRGFLASEGDREEDKYCPLGRRSLLHTRLRQRWEGVVNGAARAERRWATVAGDASLRCIEGGDDERHLVTPTPIVVASTELRLAMPAALKMLGSYSTTASKPVRCWKK
uniref:Uncharacterized protein n=1 Tax=Oryza glumipatula TaxID=40148 RepID=A0A0E0BPV5_9ORYZ